MTGISVTTFDTRDYILGAYTQNIGCMQSVKGLLLLLSAKYTPSCLRVYHAFLFMWVLPIAQQIQ